MTETTFLDATGRLVPENATGPPCCVVADVDGRPVGCALPQGHRGHHAWASLRGAPTGSKVPGKSGAERAPAARAAAARQPGGRHAQLENLCGVVSLATGSRLLCAHEPGHKGAHSWKKAEQGEEA